ncbi:hypothetical protein [Streptomyces litmocidini]|uniref:Uncharacterized protein n=1 Tax=Streptomyces litmocidini TaxID=67318 RepID=A0ABW7U010_9ACTN
MTETPVEGALVEGQSSRAIDDFREADGDFGKRLEVAVRALRG